MDIPTQQKLSIQKIPMTKKIQSGAQKLHQLNSNISNDNLGLL